jgi:deoxyadenosine/deoxycytidine kinase
MKNIISVEGNIGSGKTTLAKKLAKQLGYRLFLEPVESNPYLEKFYADPKKWAFKMQMHLLLSRSKAHKLAQLEALTDYDGIGGIVMDRSVWGDRVFAKTNYLIGNIDELAWRETYEQYFQMFTAEFRMPATVIYLDVSPEVCLERMQKRDRTVEKDVALDYLKRIHKGYLDLISECESGLIWGNHIKIIKWAYNTDHVPLEDLLELIRKQNIIL